MSEFKKKWEPGVDLGVNIKGFHKINLAGQMEHLFKYPSGKVPIGKTWKVIRQTVRPSYSRGPSDLFLQVWPGDTAQGFLLMRGPTPPHG